MNWKKAIGDFSWKRRSEQRRTEPTDEKSVGRGG